MVHILASLAFTLVAFAALGLTAFMLLQDQDKIMTALGLSIDPAPRAVHRPVRVRTAGRWQAASATAARPWRAVA
ncbi:hypothetical protein DMC47_42540 [Nostoc sp. 3335mG]|nr:hypothetical protein DMC47_42540 [Nostoc sp. 3335mG]